MWLCLGMFGVTIVTNIFEVTNYLGLGNRDEHFGNPDEHFGNRDEHFGNRDEHFGNSDEHFGNRDEDCHLSSLLLSRVCWVRRSGRS